MNKRDTGETGGSRGRLHYRDTLRILRGYLVPREPNPEFSRRLEELCESMGAEELFWAEHELRVGGTGRRNIIIGGAICSVLPFMGVAAYAIRKYLLRRRVVPMGI
jgi:hypothetical protein